MANKQTEYNRGRQQGLEMSCRLLSEAGDDFGVRVIQEELHRRGRLGISTAATTKELDEAAGPIKLCMYESFLCMALMVLRDKFEFGEIRCRRFLEGWRSKESCMEDGLVKWQEYVDAVKEELNITLPTEEMRKNELI